MTTRAQDERPQGRVRTIFRHRASSAFNAALLLFLCGIPVEGHVGQIVYPIYELSSADLPVFHDDTLDDWDQVLPNASLTQDDFAITDGSQVDLEDFAFRVFLAWHSSSQQVMVGVEMLDDIYLGPVDGTIGNGWLRFVIDGDHTGGEYLFTEDGERLPMDQAQVYAARPEAIDGRLLSLLEEAYGIARPPWGDVAGFVIGESPTLSGIELRVTPWDNLDWRDLEGSYRSRLAPGRIVGFGLEVVDADIAGEPDGVYTLAGIGIGALLNAQFLVDGVLIPCSVGDCTGSATSSIEPNTWAMIKASLRTED
jgi:hypothetical protein